MAEFSHLCVSSTEKINLHYNNKNNTSIKVVWIPVRKVSFYWQPNAAIKMRRKIQGWPLQTKAKKRKRKGTMQAQQSWCWRAARMTILHAHNISFSLVLPVTLSLVRPRPVDCPLIGLCCQAGHVKTRQHLSELKSGPEN